MENKPDYKVQQATHRIKSSHDLGMLGLDAVSKVAEVKETGIELPIDVNNINGVKNLRDYFAPLLPFEICAIQAQTSNGKTMFKDWWLRQVIKQFKEQGRNQVIVDVHLEESLEQVAFSEFGRRLGVRSADFARGEFTDFGKIKGVCNVLDGVPVWHIGISAEDPEDAPELTLSNIYRAMMALKNGDITGEKVSIGLWSVDYLQALPYDPEVSKERMDSRRRLQVARDVHILRDMTIKLEAPGLVPLQAKQELTRTIEPYHIPQMYDGSETMTIATRFDRIVSLWMPSTTHPNHLGGQIANDKTGEVVPVAPNNMILQVIKQRGGLPKGEKWHLGWDFQTYEVKDVYKK